MSIFKHAPLALALSLALPIAATAGSKFPVTSITAGNTIELKVEGTFRHGNFDEGAAEIAAYDPDSERLFVTNAEDDTLDVLSIKNPNKPKLAFEIDLDDAGLYTDIAGFEFGGVNSVASLQGLVAVAVEHDFKQGNGAVVFFDAGGDFISAVEVGALPDMVTFTPDGMYVLVANEGEPSDDYSVDPEGSVSLIYIGGGADDAWVDTADFDEVTIPDGVRITGPINTSPAQDLEPEYIAVSSDSMIAWVTLQENNAVAVVDIGAKMISAVIPLGTKNHNVVQNALDASNRDNDIIIRPWPTHGLYMPDAIARYDVDGAPYLVTANEGDGREYISEVSMSDCEFVFEDDECIYTDEARVKDVTLADDFDLPPGLDADALQADGNLGRLKIASTEGVNNNGYYEQLFSFGSRSFSIWNGETGELVYDSGSDFERRTAAALPEYFNSTNDDNSFDVRSDDKGPEPEGVAVGTINDHTYAFIGLERIGGIMVYDVTNPVSPEFQQYINNRDFSADIEEAGDLGPEGMLFIPASQSPKKRDLLVVSNEVSGTTTIYSIKSIKPKD
jgi:DNA-binding beta-propeller fold protein YncE